MSTTVSSASASTLNATLHHQVVIVRRQPDHEGAGAARSDRHRSQVPPTTGRR